MRAMNQFSVMLELKNYKCIKLTRACFRWLFQVASESKIAVESNSVVESSAAVNIAEPDETQPAAAPAAKSSSAPQQKQHQNGPFGVGSSEEAKEHRSTRVTQPPGGRSTKLWWSSLLFRGLVFFSLPLLGGTGQLGGWRGIVKVVYTLSWNKVVHFVLK